MNGVAQTPIFAPTSDTNGGSATHLVPLPDGTTVDLTVVSDASTRPTISAWTLNQQATLVDSQMAVVAGASTSLPVTVATEPDGFAIAGFSAKAGPGDITWTNATERYEFSASQPSARADADPTSGSSLTMTANLPVASTSSTRIAGLSFRWGV